MANWDWLFAMAKGNFLAGPGFEQWNGGTSFTDPADAATLSDGWSLSKGGTSAATANFTRESTTKDTGTYSMKVAISGAGSSNSYLRVKQSVSNFSRFAGQSVAFSARVKVGTASKVRLSLYDGVTTAYSDYHTGDDTWQKLTVALACSASISELTVKIEITSDFTGNVFIDSSFLYAIQATMSSTTRAALEYFGPDDPLSLLIGTLTVLANATIAGTLGVTGATTLGTLSAGATGLSGDLDMNGNDITEAASLNGSFLGLGRNRVTNGTMRIDQRKAGAATTVNSAAATYTLDRWFAAGQSTDGVFTVQRSTSTPPTGFSHFLRATVSTADASIGSSQAYVLVHRIEGQNLLDFLLGSASAKTFTLSFWVRSSVTGTFSGAVKNSAANRSYPFTYDISSANTWEKKTVTIVGDTSGTWLTTNGIGMEIDLDLGAGTSVRGTAGAWGAANYVGATGATSLIATNAATWDITGVQLEIGSQATEFEYVPFQMELARCQRYYCKTFDYSVAPAQSTNDFTGTIHAAAWSTTNKHHGGQFVFPVEMRTAPTVTTYNPNGANAFWRDIGNANSTTTAAVENISTRQAWVYINEVIGAADNFTIHAAADAEL